MKYALSRLCMLVSKRPKVVQVPSDRSNGHVGRNRDVGRNRRVDARLSKGSPGGSNETCREDTGAATGRGTRNGDCCVFPMNLARKGHVGKDTTD